MTYHLRVRHQVESDIEAVAYWYEERQPGLGSEFVHEIRQAMTRLAQNPFLYPI
jgi:toxin ParE1/3/4